MRTNVKQFIANNKVLSTVDNYPIKSITLGEDEYVLNYNLEINYNNSAQSDVSSNFDRTKVSIRTGDRTITVGNTSYSAGDKSGHEFKGWEYNNETVSGNIEFYPLEDVSITALWEKTESTECTLKIGVFGFAVGIDKNRIPRNYSTIITGFKGEQYSYKLEDILSLPDAATEEYMPGLVRIGATTQDYAEALPYWKYNKPGTSERPEIVFEKNLTFTGTFEQGTVEINYTYVYEYTDGNVKTYFR